MEAPDKRVGTADAASGGTVGGGHRSTQCRRSPLRETASFRRLGPRPPRQYPRFPMPTFKRAAARLAAMLCLFALAGAAHAQATHTWVSGTGDDANPCSRTSPCKTFAGTISKTASGGRISVLDAGGMGALNITKPITIDGYGTGSPVMSSSINGFIVNIPAPA